MEHSKLFQAIGPATTSARSPNVLFSTELQYYKVTTRHEPMTELLHRHWQVHTTGANLCITSYSYMKEI